MKAILFGASGMIGQGLLRECLQDPGIKAILSVVRAETGIRHPKLREIVHRDFLDFTPIEQDLAGFDACFFCLGISAAGLTEADYRRVTHGITLAAARALLRLNPALTFLYISGAGTDGTERGRSMWARVKGKTENDLLALPFKAAYMFRPAGIQPLHGIQSKTRSYRILYALLGPLLPALRRLFPAYLTTTEQLAKAMLRVAREGAPTRILEAADLPKLG
jgi:uncharacterized protein YbjT (DUF2867 family)